MKPCILNSGKKRVLCKKTVLADSYFKRLRGLMFSKKNSFDHALIFPLESESRVGSSIHMMFVFFPIDVLWLDSEKRIVDMREGLEPWTPNASPKKPAKYIVELPRGTISEKQPAEGQELSW